MRSLPLFLLLLSSSCASWAVTINFAEFGTTESTSRSGVSVVLEDASNSL